MATNPTFNLKSGADSLLIACREDNAAGTRGKIKIRDGFWRGPYLVRQTGNSLKGTTENIDSNELRPGRAKSAPRKGTSSSDGSIDVEFSPESYDDLLEAALRGEWKLWNGDSSSDSNKDGNSFEPGYFDTKCSVRGAGRRLLEPATKMVDTGITVDANATDENDVTLSGSSVAFIVGSKVSFEDIEGEFTVTGWASASKTLTIDRNVTVQSGKKVFMKSGPSHSKSSSGWTISGAISTAQDFIVVKDGDIPFTAGDKISIGAADGTEYTVVGYDASQKKVTLDKNVSSASDDDVVYICKTDDFGFIEVPYGAVVHELNPGTKDIKFSMLRKYGGQEGEDLYQEFEHVAVNEVSMSVEIGSIVTGSFAMMGNNNPELKDTDGIKEHFNSRVLGGIDGNGYIGMIPQKACDTDQFTAREGFLYLNGRQIQFANSLSFTLNNGLEKSFAIFEPNAISTTPLSLDITGDLQTYLIKDGSDKIFNDAVKDETVEILFAIQNKLENPDAIYVFQVFTAKHTDASVDGQGSGTYNISLPWQSFNERAMRIFRIMLPRAVDVKENLKDDNAVYIMPNMNIASDFVASDMKVTVSGVAINDLGIAVVTDESSDYYGMIKVPVTSSPVSGSIVTIDVEWNGKKFTKSFEYTE